MLARCGAAWCCALHCGAAYCGARSLVWPSAGGNHVINCVACGVVLRAVVRRCCNRRARGLAGQHGHARERAACIADRTSACKVVPRDADACAHENRIFNVCWRSGRGCLAACAARGAGGDLVLEKTHRKGCGAGSPRCKVTLLLFRETKIVRIGEPSFFQLRPGLSMRVNIRIRGATEMADILLKRRRRVAIGVDGYKNRVDGGRDILGFVGGLHCFKRQRHDL